MTQAAGETRNFGLDLIRASAIMLVVTGHCTAVFCKWWQVSPPLTLVYGSFVGVELFFVLSGFLVGRLAIRAAARPHPGTWLAFMQRRWLRTLPLYYLWLVVLAVIWPPLFWQPDAAGLRWQALAVFGSFTQNLAWPTAFGNWFGVSWSLAVEEWFYLLLPAGLFLLGPRIGRNAAVAASLAVLLLLPAVLRGFVFNPLDMPHAVVSTLDQIAIGVALGWLQLARPALFARLVWAAPLGAALYLSFWFLPGSIWAACPPLLQAQRVSIMGLGLGLLLPAALRLPQLGGPAGWLVRRISTYSYGLYIVHLSVLELVDAYQHNRGVGSAACIAESLVLMLLLAVLSWHVLERPMLARRPALPAGAA